MVRDARADHLDASDEVAFDPERLGDVNAGYPSGEIAHVRDLAGRGQLDLRHGSIHVEYAVRPDDAPLFVDQREPPVVDVIDDGQVAALQLLFATRSHVVKAAG